jgi:hypothetical protein
MLSWLAEHGRVSASLLREAQREAGKAFNKQRGAVLFRGVIPWQSVESGLQSIRVARR